MTTLLLLAETSLRLGTATDEMNSAISELQGEVVGLQIGVEAWVDLPGEPKRSLGFGRLSDEWMFLIRSSDNVKPLLRSSRDTRIRACAEMGALFAAINKAGSDLELRMRLTRGGVSTS